MRTTALVPSPEPTWLIGEALAELVSMRRFNESAYVNMPLLFPSGTAVTVRIDQAPGGYRVSDNGFAYREMEDLGAERSFAKTADSALEGLDIKRNTRAFFVDVPVEFLSRAVAEIAALSWKTVDKVYEKHSDEEAARLSDEIKLKLGNLFGVANLLDEPIAIGVSSTPWDMTAIVQFEERRAIFQAVSAHQNSIWRTSTAFQDLSLLDRPPSLIAVVKDKKILGAKQTLLTQAGGRVIQQGDRDQTFQRAAA